MPANGRWDLIRRLKDNADVKSVPDGLYMCNIS